MAVDRPEYRLSDAERQEALDALSEHVRTGRLDLVEFDERSAQVSSAKLRRDLEPLFADLPEPKPGMLTPVRGMRPATPYVPPAAPPPAPAPAWRQRLASSIVPIAAVLAVLLFFTVARGMIFVFALPAIAALLAGAIAGNRHDRRRRRF
ncbi:DUF1707 SHOCT-like domain-containing protein [Prauserella muralis]|uniref:DUF1707 domain-containing protein n=1 Tax=Prauserella muralis TaxID=588067 RepID=A0A2V4BNZ9_9PSEU|nr:DUF1707 domain-containing protein [Prauserella muralis]PXY32343.1 hypothetical protein BAY60_08725 [Prauserella muralis]TWE23975.1 uncharacterized protein DUF1707 [Prauserella muralis]